MTDWGLTLRQLKCKLFRSSVKFLGKIIDSNGIRPDPDKVRAINDMPEPHDVSSLRSFLGRDIGMVNFHQTFIPVANLRVFIYIYETLKQSISKRRKSSSWNNC